MTRKLRILCDMDGVLAETLTPWLAEYTRLTGEYVSVAAITRYAFEDFVRFPDALLAALDTGRVFERAQPEAGAIAGMEALLAAGHDVRIVTYVLPETHTGHEQKLRWLRQWLPGFRRQHVNFMSSDEKQFLDGNVLIEDRPKTIEEWMGRYPAWQMGADGRPIAPPRRCAFLIDQGYNCDWDAEGHAVVRVNNLLEVAGILEKERQR